MKTNAAPFGLISAFLILACFTLSVAVKAGQPARLALLIGNQNYSPEVGPLKNPLENVALIEAALEKLGFKVTVLKDADYRTMDIGLKRYVYEVRRAGKDAVSLFYYSGHGLANPQSHVNYLLPVSVENTDDKSLWLHSIPQLTILDMFARQAPDAIQYLVFDAARGELKLSPNDAKTDKGLARIDNAGSLLVAYATGSMKSASGSGDGPDAYTKALAAEIVKPDIEALAMFRNVQAIVGKSTGQTPWLSSTTMPPVYLVQSQAALLLKEAQEKAEAAAIKPAAGNEPKVGESFRDCRNCPEMVVVPAGSFVMGSPDNEPERENDEGPQHKVTIAKPFAVGKFTVTFDEWDACVAAGGCGLYTPKDNDWGRGDLPTINIGWDDAQAYVKWLSKKTGASYRLLSEAEWEYVARAGSSTTFWWGPTISPDQADYNGSVLYRGGGTKGEFRNKTVPVKFFKPNPWGLYQVHGNVWEWVEDCWNSNYEGAPADGSARTTGSCGSYIVRGGAWTMGPTDLRAANRIYYDAKSRNEDIGFRIAKTLD